MKKPVSRQYKELSEKQWNQRVYFMRLGTLERAVACASSIGLPEDELNVIRSILYTHKVRLCKPYKKENNVP